MVSHYTCSPRPRPTVSAKLRPVGTPLPSPTPRAVPKHESTDTEMDTTPSSYSDSKDATSTSSNEHTLVNSESEDGEIPYGRYRCRTPPSRTPSPRPRNPSRTPVFCTVELRDSDEDMVVQPNSTQAWVDDFYRQMGSDLREDSDSDSDPAMNYPSPAASGHESESEVEGMLCEEEVCASEEGL